MAFLLFALAASVVGVGVVLFRNRRPSSMEASIGDFARGLEALAPDEQLDEPDVQPPESGARRSG